MDGKGWRNFCKSNFGLFIDHQWKLIFFARFQQFRAHDRSHPQSVEIYSQLDQLSKELLQHGHEFDSSWITRTIRPNETTQSILCGHGEKLAIAFHFIDNRKPSTIQITTNLRICGDCRKKKHFNCVTSLHRVSRLRSINQTNRSNPSVFNHCSWR